MGTYQPIPMNKFVSKIHNGGEDMVKKAAYDLTSFIRREILEGGIVRSFILPTIPISGIDLDKDEDLNVNKKFMEIEPTSEGGTWIPYRDTPPQKFIKGSRVPVYFGEISGDVHVLNIYENITSGIDLRKFYDETDVKYIQNVEDSTFMTSIDSICHDNPAQQEFTYSGGLTRNNWNSARQDFFRKIPLSCALMNTKTYIELQKWAFDKDVGVPSAISEIYLDGKIPQLSGVKILQTTKSDIVADNVIYFFPPPDFLGKFFVLQEPVTYVKQENNNIMFSTMEVVGLGLGNTLSFTKNIFLP